MQTKKSLSSLSVAAAAIAGLLVVLALCGYQLRVTEVAIVSTLGRPRVEASAGFHWRLPWPIQRVTRLDKRSQLLTSNARETTTRDNINLILQSFATWKIKDPLVFFNSVGNSYEAETQLRSLLESKQEGVIRSHDLSDFLASGAPADESKARPLVAIEQEILAAIATQAARTYGIEVESVGIARISLHESNTASVLARMRQEQEKIAAAIRSQGETAAKILRDEADSRRAQKVAEAEAEARRIRGDAMIQASAQYDKFKEAPDFAIFLRKLDALQSTTKTRTTVILDSSTSPYDLLQSAPKAKKETVPDGGH